MINSIKRYLQSKWIGFLVHHLFRGITVDDVLRIKEGKIMYRGTEVTREQLHSLAVQADALLQSSLWQLLTSELQYLSEQKMFEKSMNYDDMLFGKAMLYNLDIIKQKLENLTKIGRQ